MCGIAGIFCDEPMKMGLAVAKMAEAISHRGPDDYGYIAINPGQKLTDFDLHQIPEGAHKLFFSHRRLSIIDINGSQQPLPNENASIWTVFNGEIYNYLELRDELISKGHKFKENGDTEILVHLWEEFGTKMLDKLVGMFAFAIYDANSNTLFLGRDRFGQKPLYYFEDANKFFFASELQALKTLPEFPHSSTDNIAMAHYFRYAYIPSPRTAYNGVSALQPGCFLTRINGHNSVSRYWKPSVSGEINEVDLDELQELIDQSVKLQLRTDVPLGSFLSGGIDSALITASAMKQLPSPIETYTISTGDYWCDESKEAQITAEYLGTKHHTFLVKPDFIEISAKLARHYGQPFADYSSIMTYYVSRETRKHATVALAGDGGDELFGGYGSYANSAKYAFFGRIPKFARPVLANLARIFLRHSQTNISDAVLAAEILPAKGENISGLFHEYWRNHGFNDDFVKSLHDAELEKIEKFAGFYREAMSKDPIDRWMEVDQRIYLSDDILTKVDIASMSVSLECRAPFLDHRLAEFANLISSKAKLKNHQTKYLLKQLAKRQIPHEIVDLPKKGFSMPLAEWMRKELKNSIEDRIFSYKSSWQPYLREDAVERLWNEHISGKADHHMRLWMIFVLAGMNLN